MFVALGFALTQWVNLGFYHIQEQSASWRGSLAIPALFSFIFMASIFFFPESPRWLVLRSRSDSAQRSLASLRSKDITSPEVLSELHSIETTLEESSHAPSASETSSPQSKRSSSTASSCITLQQMSGGTLISVYTPTIFDDDLDLSARFAKILASCALTWKLLSCFVGFFLIVDRAPSHVYD